MTKLKASIHTGRNEYKNTLFLLSKKIGLFFPLATMVSSFFLNSFDFYANLFIYFLHCCLRLAFVAKQVIFPKINYYVTHTYYHTNIFFEISIA